MTRPARTERTTKDQGLLQLSASPKISTCSSCIRLGGSHERLQTHVAARALPRGGGRIPLAPMLPPPTHLPPQHRPGHAAAVCSPGGIGAPLSLPLDASSRPSPHAFPVDRLSSLARSSHPRVANPDKFLTVLAATMDIPDVRPRQQAQPGPRQ